MGCVFCKNKWFSFIRNHCWIKRTPTIKQTIQTSLKLARTHKENFQSQGTIVSHLHERTDPLNAATRRSCKGTNIQIGLTLAFLLFVGSFLGDKLFPPPTPGRRRRHRHLQTSGSWTRLSCRWMTDANFETLLRAPDQLYCACVEPRRKREEPRRVDAGSRKSFGGKKLRWVASDHQVWEGGGRGPELEVLVFSVWSTCFWSSLTKSNVKQ